jgi:flavin reductase
MSNASLRDMLAAGSWRRSEAIVTVIAIDQAAAAARLAHPDRFREAMARLAGAVAIVACRYDGRPHGLLVSSLISQSIEPPRLLFCVRRDASAHAALLQADAVSLTILAAGDRAEADTFVHKDKALDRFASARWRHHPEAPPRLEGGVVSIHASIHQRLAADGHTIFIVDALDSVFCDAEPLLYFKRDFHRLADLA